MSTRNNSEVHLNLRLPVESLDLIKAAASLLGLSVNDYAVMTLARNARRVTEGLDATVLSQRDSEIFVALLDDVDARPNKALKEAARRYKKHFGRSKA